MEQQLIITRDKDRIISSLFCGQELIQVNVEEMTNSTIGNIYVGKVKNIVKNIQAAFVEIENGRMCYLALESKNVPIFCSDKKNDKICIGDELLVQISKDAIKTKNPSVTTNLQLAGKYVILTHGNTLVGVSNKITDEAERTRLKNIVAPFTGKKCGCGMILRTNSQGVEEELLKEEAETLFAKYQELKATGIYKSCFSKIYQAPCGYICDIRDGYKEELHSIITDEEEIYGEIHEYLKQWQSEDLGKLEFYQNENISLNRLYGITTKIEKALSQKVWLKSGGYLVIQPTEALTVIDVNSGKAIVGKKAMEEHFLRINKEAAMEIARQLRLRNLSGIIIVDFIDMKYEINNRELLSVLQEQFQKDPVKTVVVDMTKLHLVEITRKKVRKPLHEQIRME